MSAAIPALTLAERSVLITCTEAFGHRAYQPPEDLLEAADALIGRGLLAKNPAWPDTLIATAEGQRAYDAVRWDTCRTCGLEIYPTSVAGNYVHIGSEGENHPAKPIPA